MCTETQKKGPQGETAGRAKMSSWAGLLTMGSLYPTACLLSTPFVRGVDHV